MKTLERCLLAVDTNPWSIISRVGIGLGIPPAFHSLFGDLDSVWAFPAFFLLALIALRVVPAVLRSTLPFSTETKSVWAERRGLAKQYDSYQWQKLLWIGLGLLPYVAIPGEAKNVEVLVTVFCLIGGSLGLLIWRKVDGLRATPST